MVLKGLLHQLLWTILIKESIGAEDKSFNSIFENNYCDVKCGGLTHTMCPIKNRKPLCDDFELYSFRSDKYEDQLKILIHGHNGIRNRIAERMYVPNMLEMSWDYKLALMAENFLHRCDDRITDPCTLQPRILFEEDTINEFFTFNVSEHYIVQNTYYEKSHFYPFKFLERVIRSWYFEKDGMRQPTIVENVQSEYKIKRLLGENNFTHFGYPFIYRFGCGMAKYKEGFHIVCNYYPFYRTVTNTMYFQTGDPDSECPARFPLRDDMFLNLCTDESDNYFGNGISEVGNNKADCLRSFDELSLLALELTILFFMYACYDIL